MKASRVALGFAVAACGALVLWASFGGGGKEPAPAPGPVAPGPGPGAAPAPGPAAPAGTTGRTFSNPAQCRECHAEAYEEWSASMHAKAWTEPEVRALSDDFKSTECLSCHAPQPIHGAPVGGRVFERASRFETGVDCLSCHLLPDGGVAATRDLPSAPCRPTKVETLRDAVTCKGCHNQHYLVDEFDTLFRAPDPAKGALLKQARPESCLDCHMQPAKDGKRRDHTFRGGHYEEILKRAMTFQARIENGSVVAETTNTGAGHKAPADSRHRSFNVWVTVTTEGGVTVHDRTEIAEFRMYYRSPPRDNTNLRPGETGVGRLPLPKGVKGKVLVELVYCMNPIKKDKREAKKIESVALEFDTTK